MNDPRESDLPPTPSMMPPLPRPSALRRLASRVGWALVAILTLLASLALSIAIHGSLPQARSLSRTLIEDLASGALRGDLEIGRVEELGLGRARLTDVVLRDDQGRIVISSEEVTVWPDFRRFFVDGTIRIAGARVVRPFVRLYTVDEIGGPDPMGLEVSLVRAFLPTTEGQPGASPIHIAIDGLRIEQATVFGDAPRFPGLRVEELDVYGRIDIEEEVVISVYDAHGRMTAPYRGDTVVDRVALRFTSNWDEGLDAYVLAHREGSTVDARVRVTRPGGEDTAPHVWIRAHADPLEAATLEAMGFAGTGALMGRAHGHLVLEGPNDELDVLGWFQTDGGPVRVDGTLRSEGRYSFEVHTEGLQLDAVVRRVPPVLVAGTATIDLDTTSGELAPPRVTVDLSPLEVGGYVLPPLRGEVTVTDDAIVIDSIAAPDLSAGAGGTVSGGGRIGFDGTVDLALELDVVDIGRDPNVARLVPGARGAVRGSLRVQSGPLATDLGYDFDLDIRDFRYGPVRARRLLARGFLRGELSRPVTRIATSGEGLRTGSLALGTFRGSLRGGPARYELELDVRGGSPIQSAHAVASAVAMGDGTFELTSSAFELDPGVGRFRQSAPIRMRVGRAGARIDALALVGDPERAGAEPPRVVVTGSVGPQRASDLRVQLTGYPLERLASSLPEGLVHLAGSADGTLGFDGDLDAPTVTLSGRIADLSLDRLRSADVTYEVRHSEGTLALRLEGVLGDRGTMLLEGPIEVPYEALFDRARFVEQADFHGLRIAVDQVGVPFLLPFVGIDPSEYGVSGKISVSGELEGTFAAPRVQSLVVILDRVSLEGWTPVRLKLDLGLAGDHLRVRRLWLADVDGEIALAQGDFVLPLHDVPEDGAGWVSAIVREPWSVALRLEPRRLEALPRPFSKDLPRGVRLAGSLSASGGPDGASATFDASLRWETPTFDHPCARYEQPVIQIRGRTTRDDIASLESSEEGTTTAITASMFADGRRVASATATASTPLDAWLGRGVMPTLPETLVELVLEDVPLGRVPWTCPRAAGRANGRASFTAFSSTPALVAEVEIDELRIRDQSAQGASQPFHVSFVSRTEGTDWTALSACTVITEQDRDRTPIGRCPLTFLAVTDEGRAVSFDRAAGSAAVPLEGEAIVRASVPIRFQPPSPIPELGLDRAVYVQGLFSDAHLGPLLTVIPGIAEADAIGEGTVELRATDGQVQLTGGLQISEGRARVVSLGQHLRDVEGFLHFRGNRVVIDEDQQLRASDPVGRIAMDGEIGFEGLLPAWVDVHIFPDGFPFRREGAVLASLSGHAGLRAHFSPEGLDGEIRTSSFEVRLPDRMAGSVLDLEARRDVLVIGDDAFELTSDSGTAYPYHLHLDATEPFVVRRNDFEARLTAELNIRYEQPELIVTGSAVLHSGTFEVFGKRFAVARGSLLFLEDEPLDPVIDLVAVYALPGRSGASISVEVSGQLSDMQIAFTSTETNDVGQIISLLVAGSSSRSAEETAQQAGNQAANFMAGLAAGVLTLTLRRELGDVGSVVPAVSVETVGSAGTLRARAYWDATFIIPDFLREVVLGASVEGFFTSDQGSGQSGGSSGSSGVGGGLTIDLQFPYGIRTTGTYVPPQSWGTDLLWQP